MRNKPKMWRSVPMSFVRDKHGELLAKPRSTQRQDSFLLRSALSVVPSMLMMRLLGSIGVGNKVAA